MKIPFDELPKADLAVDAVYLQGAEGRLQGEPLHALMGFPNMGGFRVLGGWRVPGARAVALFSTGNQPEWPDRHSTGDRSFVYYGDNRDPSRSVEQALQTKAKGNRLLRTTFDALHAGRRAEIPPFLVFEQDRAGDRSVRFVGLAAPGSDLLGEEEDLVAAWTSTETGERFINYRATFTVLEVDEVPRAWLDRLAGKGDRLEDCPGPWRRFVETGRRLGP